VISSPHRAETSPDGGFVRQGYGVHDEHLVRIKCRNDPDNSFRLNHDINRRD